MAKSKKNKKSPKRSACYENLKDVNNKLYTLVQKCDGGKCLDRLTDKQKVELWSGIEEILLKRPLEGEVVNEVISCVDVLHQILNGKESSVETNPSFLKIVKLINNDEFTSLDTIKNNISKVNESWMFKKYEEIEGMEYFTLKHLLPLCLIEKPLVGDMQRLSSIRKSLTAAPFEKAIPSLRPLLIKLVQNGVVLASEHGQRFIAHVLTLTVRLMSDIHKTIVLDLNFCNKKKATCYGKIYVMAWHSASDEMKTHLEKTCFQHLMEMFLKEQRTSLEITKNGHNVMSVLQVWHLERKKKHPHFLTMITDCYQPIIWKYLKSGFNVHRCNAADLFFKAFPLERPGDNVMDSERLFNEQFATMEALLVDDCHIVRIIAIREICNILSHYWNSFTSEQIQKLMSIISKKDASDASSAEVRRMVYVGFQSLVKAPLSFEYLKQILPILSDNIHDVNQRVRISFLQLLISIQEKKDPSFKYSHVVSMYNIYFRLAEEGNNVGQWIVRLLMNNYYQTNMPVIEWTKRFIFLVKTYPRAYRNFFLYSNKVLPFDDAYVIMNELLVQMGLYIMSKVTVDQENEEVIDEKPTKKRRRSKTPLGDWNRKKENASQSPKEPPKECAFDDPVVMAGLFDIISILWVLHDNKLNSPENEEKKMNLYSTYIKYAQPFINYYKDSNLFLSVLTLSSNIPVSLLRNNSITLPGYCMKTLKSIKLDSMKSTENVFSMLLALVKWKRGNEILEQVSLWLDAAFETQNMNATVLPMRRVKISETIQPNSIAAIYILDTLLKIEYAKSSILKKNYNQLFELWEFMSRIKHLIITRLELGEPFDEDLVSDEFLKLCFRRFVKLIPLLKENPAEANKEEAKEVTTESNETKESQESSRDQTNDEKVTKFDHQKEIERVISWAENNLYPLLQQKLDSKEVDLITNLLNDLLYVSDNMIVIHCVNSMFYFKVGHFILKLLSTDYSLHFVKAGSRIASALNFSAKLLFRVRDDLQIFSKLVPSILSNILDVLTRKKYSTSELGPVIQVLPAIKVYFNKILATYQDNFKTKTSSKDSVRQLQLIVGLFVDSIIVSIAYEIPREDMSVPVYSNLSQLPPLASSFMSLFYNRNFWGPLFVLVLNSRLASNEYDCKSIIASILVLHICANCDKKMNQTELTKALASASSSLSKSKLLLANNRISDQLVPESNRVSEIEKSRRISLSVPAETSNTDTLNVKRTDSETWPSNAAVRGSKRSTLKDNWPSNVASAADGISHMSTDTDFNEDFIECGFELIKNVEKILSSRNEENQEES